MLMCIYIMAAVDSTGTQLQQLNVYYTSEQYLFIFKRNIITFYVTLEI
jgi:hypothetical protein